MTELTILSKDIVPVYTTDDGKCIVLGRELHAGLRLAERYSKWFERMCGYGFAEGSDYTPYQMVHPQNNQPIEDHYLTLDMAKELAMIQRTPEGKAIREKLIALEKAWSSPEQVMARALKMADAQIRKLQATNSRLTVVNQIMAPKADYFDELVDRNLLTGFRDTAKELHVKQTDFVTFLLERGYIYRSGKKGELKPYAQYVEAGLFEVKETFNEKTDWKGTQTMITPKGRETFRLLVPGARKGCAE